MYDVGFLKMYVIILFFGKEVLIDERCMYCVYFVLLFFNVFYLFMEYVVNLNVKCSF